MGRPWIFGAESEIVLEFIGLSGSLGCLFSFSHWAAGPIGRISLVGSGLPYKGLFWHAIYGFF